MNLNELARFLSDLFPLQGINDFCPNGLQVEGKNKVERIATAVTANVDTIKSAVSLKADALLVHHGLFWRGDSEAIKGAKKEKISLLLENGISLFAYHLPMDLHREVGNNWNAAKEMGWTDLQPFGTFNGVFVGVKGTVPSSSREDFKNLLEEYYQHPATTAFGGPSIIETAALVSGGAHKTIVEAIEHDVDAFITGSFDLEVWDRAKEGNGVNFFAMGHSATERIGPRALAEYLSARFSVPCQFIDIENPF